MFRIAISVYAVSFYHSQVDGRSLVHDYTTLGRQHSMFPTIFFAIARTASWSLFFDGILLPRIFHRSIRPLIHLLHRCRHNLDLLEFSVKNFGAFAAGYW